MKNITKLLLFSVFCTLMVNVTLSDKSDFFSNTSIFKLSIASANSGEGGTKCSRIKTFCTCYDGSNMFKGMSILSCEEYELVPPLVCDNCHTTSCPPGTARCQ